MAGTGGGPSSSLTGVRLRLLVVTGLLLISACGSPAAVGGPPTAGSFRAASSGGECRNVGTNDQRSQIARVSLAVRPRSLTVTWTLRTPLGHNGALYVNTSQAGEKQPHFFGIEGDRAFVSYEGQETGTRATVQRVGSRLIATFYEVDLPPVFDWMAEITDDIEVVASCPGPPNADDRRVHFVT